MTENDSTLIAANYRMIAGVYEMSAKKLAAVEEWDDNGKPMKLLTPIPIYQLCSHAAELYLKAALLKRGHSESEIKKFEYRHNLEALLDLIVLKQLPVSEKTKSTIIGLSKQHKEHLLRYSKIENGFF